MHRHIAALAICCLAVSACTGSGSDDPSDDATEIFSELSSPPEEASPTASEDVAPSPSDSDSADASGSASPSEDDSSADEIDVTTTPDEITEEWAEAVINTLLAEYGEIASEVLALPVLGSPDDLDPAYYDRVRELFDGPYEERRIAGLGELAVDEDLIRSSVLPSGSYSFLRTSAVEVQAAEPDCLVVVGEVDVSGVQPDGETLPFLAAWSLTPATDANGGTNNPTQWVVVDDLANTGDDGPLPDQVMLDATLSDYDGVLENSCQGDGQ